MQNGKFFWKDLFGKMVENKKRVVVFFIFGLGILGVSFFAWHFATTDKKTIAVESLNIVSAAMKLLPIEADTKKAIAMADTLAQAVMQKDGVTRTYMIMLQNNYELRPGGGFLGQYAVVKIKDGEVIKFALEDANLLDQRITAKIPSPYPLNKKMTKNWKFRDSNFSPDFPTNVSKAQYFYKMAGGWEKFDGVIAINADVFNEALKITGPVTVPGYPGTTFTSEDGALVLEETVERAYLGDDVPAESKQHRKDIMKALGGEMVTRLAKVENIPKLVTFARTQLENKNIMLYFTDETIQKSVEDVHWDGSLTPDWGGDYIFAVDANLGALKTDYFMDRKLTYSVDLTVEKPTATITYAYTNRATHGDWRTSDYHTYLRVYVPQGSVLLDRKMIGSPRTGEEFGKTYFGAMVDVRMGETVEGMITYQLPDRFKTDSYKLLIQKQSGVQNVPVDVTIKTQKGDVHQTGVLTKDSVFMIQSQ